MSYPGTPSALSDGDFLPSNWLNQLAACAAYLQGVGEPSNTGFFARYLTDATTINYRLRHRHRYLKLRYTSNGDGGEVDDIKVYYGGVLIYTDSSPNTVSGYTLVLDLQSTAVIDPAPTVGDWYTVALEVAFYSSGFLELQMLCEDSDNASI